MIIKANIENMDNGYDFLSISTLVFSTIIVMI